MRKTEDKAHKQEVANRLREIRNSLGLTQEKFAELLELSVSAYKKVESADNQISIDSLRRLNQQLKVSSDYVLWGKQANPEVVWEHFMNCSEADKMLLYLRAMNYFVRLKSGQYCTQEVQSMYDEKLLNILKEMDI